MSTDPILSKIRPLATDGARDIVRGLFLLAAGNWKLLQAAFFALPFLAAMTIILAVVFLLPLPFLSLLLPIP